MIFAKEGLHATEFEMEGNNMKYTQMYCGKLDLLLNQRHIIGYIIDENKGKWKTLLANNEIIYKKAIVYCDEKKKYVYPVVGKYIITYYWPICLHVKFNGRGVRMTINRIAFQRKRGNDYKILREHSS